MIHMRLIHTFVPCQHQAHLLHVGAGIHQRQIHMYVGLLLGNDINGILHLF